MADVKFLYDTFNIYYNKGIEAREKSNIDLAKRSFLLAAETLLKMAKESKGELQKVRFERANRLIEMSENLEVNLNITQNEKIVSNDNFSQEDIKFSQSKIPNISFNDVAGLEEVKKSINTRIILPMQNKEIYERFKKEIGGGVLLYGPPGTGKTMIAKAIANEINAKLYFVKCSDIASKWFGESERKVKDLFNEARKNERAVIFFDEFEALGIDRDANDSPCKRIVCELLAQLNGFDKGESTLLVIAATNRPWEIDSALLRNGRISTHICVPLPDYESRMLILNKELENVPLDNSFSFDRLTKLTEGFSGADIVEVTNKLKDLAINRSIEAKAISSINNRDIDYIEPMIKSSVSKKDLDKIETFKTN